MNRIFGILLMFALVKISFAQDAWSFQDCVDYALEHNLNLNQSKLNIAYAANTALQNKMDLFTPNINATVTEGFNFSNSINPLTYQFVTQNTTSTSMGLFMDFSIFQGLSRISSLKAAELDLDAAQMEQLELENNTKLTLANFYLNALLAKEALQITKDQNRLTLNQYKNTLALVQAGMLASGDKYEVEAQLANDELNIVNAENNLENALNQIKFLLQLDPFLPFDIQNFSALDLVIDETTITTESLSQIALKNLPNIKASEMRLESAKNQLKAAKGSLSPTLSVSAYLGSNYFSAAQEQVGEQIITTPIGLVSGTSDVVVASYSSPILGNKSFGNQVNDNFNQNVRINLNIPLFGKWQRMIAIDNAKLNILKSTFDVDLKKNALQQDIFTAQTNLKAAAKKYAANMQNREAAGLAYNYANEKYSVGVINNYEYETAKNRFIAAQTSVVQAKFEYLFRKMIANFYLTGTLGL
jgi:outer membrane protein